MLYLVSVYDMHDQDVEIGQLRVTVKCLDALRAVQREMQLDSSSISISQ